MAKIDPFVGNLTPESMQDPQVLFYLDRFLHDIWAAVTESTGDFGTEIINPGPLQLARLAVIEQRLGSGDALTSDETGFTVDSTALSVDMDES